VGDHARGGARDAAIEIAFMSLQKLRQPKRAHLFRGLLQFRYVFREETRRMWRG
jgi:hypothetical protein